MSLLGIIASIAACIVVVLALFAFCMAELYSEIRDGRPDDEW